MLHLSLFEERGSCVKLLLDAEAVVCILEAGNIPLCISIHVASFKQFVRGVPLPLYGTHRGRLHLCRYYQVIVSIQQGIFSQKNQAIASS